MADFSALKSSIQNYIKQNGNEEITGNLLQQILLSMVSTLGDSAINNLVTALNTEIANRGNADTELGGRITTLQGVVNGIVANIQNGYVYAGIATPSTTPASGRVFYLALTAGTYTNFGETVVPQGINILKYNGSAWSLDTFIGLDDVPTQGSNNLVKSGGVEKLVSSVRDRVGVPSLRNGSAGNPTNPNFVSTYVFPTYGNKYIKITTNRPNAANCHYVYGIALTASESDLDSIKKYDAWNSKLYKVDLPNGYVENVIDISSYPTAIGMSITIGEYNGSIAQILRITDFEKYSVNIEFLDEKLQEKDEEEQYRQGIENKFVHIKDRVGVPSLRNGSAGNLTNPNFISTFVFPTNGNKKIKITTNRPNAVGCHYAFGIALSASVNDLDSAVNYDAWNSKVYKRDIASNYTENIIDISAYPTAIGMSITIGEYNGTTAQILRTTDFEKYSVSIEYYDDKMSEESDNALYKSVINGNGLSELQNGSVGNSSNPNAICNVKIVDVTKAKYAKFITTRRNRAGYKYLYWFVLFNESSGNVRPATTDRVVRETGFMESDTVDIRTGELGLGVAVFEVSKNDGTYNPLRVTDFEGEYCSIITDNCEIWKLIEETTGFFESPVNRYKEKSAELVSASRYNVVSNGSKNLQLMLITDIHSDQIPTENAVEISNAFNTVDALLCMGDICSSRYLDDTFKEKFNQIMAKSEKPYYVCVGNHDVGNSYYVGFCATHQQEYDTFIKPIVDLGYLVNTEYANGKSYYYHDFTNRSIRLIVLNEYDEPLDFDEQYWKAVQYSDTYSNIALNHTYSVGEKINVPNYTEYSFECVQGVTTPSVIGDSSKTTIPSYKIRRGNRVIRQTQAQWFLDTLCSTPANYSVVVMVHAPFSANSSNQKEKKFAQNLDISGSNFIQSCMTTDFIANAVNAFVNGSNYSENVVMNGEAAYLNTEGGGTYAYSVQKDFSTKNSGVNFLCYVGGHCHRDLIFKHDTYMQYEISPICAVTDFGNNYGNDIKREVASVFGNNFGIDSLTCISFDSDKKVRLVKIGSNLTIDMYKRDFELIDLNS